LEVIEFGLFTVAGAFSAPVLLFCVIIKLHAATSVANPHHIIVTQW